MNTIKLNTIGDSPVVVKKGSQVQSQEKTVEITENGTTEVVPDAGYALSKVTVNTNVESSGKVTYLSLSHLDLTANDNASLVSAIIDYATLIKIKPTTMYGATFQGAMPFAVVKSIGVNNDGIDAVMVEEDLLVFDFITLTHRPYIEHISDVGLLERYNSLPRLTKEEFYAL